MCLVGTNEPHLKRAIERRSQYWAQSNRSGAGVYDIRFELQDQPQDYSSTFLKPQQLYNHFQNNNEITTKSGLCRTLYSNTCPKMGTDNWFPRCYDLSQSGQNEELLDDYLRTSAQIIIKKHYDLFKQIAG